MERPPRVHPIVIFVVMAIALFVFGGLFTLLGHPWLTILVLVAYFVWAGILNRR